MRREALGMKKKSAKLKKQAGWGEVGKFQVGKNYWTSTGANLRETGTLLLDCNDGHEFSRFISHQEL